MRWIYTWLAFFIFAYSINAQNYEHIVSMHYFFANNGAVETHLLKLTQLLNSKNINSSFITHAKSTYIIEQAIATNTPYYVFTHDSWSPSIQDLEAVHAVKPITTLICNAMAHLNIALAFKEKYQVKVVFTHHYYLSQLLLDNIAQFNKVDALVTVSTLIPKKLAPFQKNNTLQSTIIQHIAPFWRDEFFASFIPKRSRKDFFKQEYGLTIDNETLIITMLANLHWYKNQSLLIKATKKIQSQNIPFKVLLAGSGDDRKKLENESNLLELSNHVHFLGSVSNTPELLYYTDIHALSSSHEGFGIAHVEAALMHKPFVGATENGIQECIQHYTNGLLFENNNATDLANVLIFLLQNKKQRIEMGNNAYEYVQKNYSSSALLAQWINLFNQLS